MRTSLAALAIGAFLLAGCSASPTPTSASPTPSDTTSESPSVTPSATPSETPSPTETAVEYECPPWSGDPDFTAAAIGPASYAGVCVGQTFDEARGTGAPVEAPEACPWYGQIVAIDDPGFYVTALSDPSQPGERIQFFIMYWQSDPADAAEFGLPATAEGITIGSSAADVLDAYPGATEVIFDDMARGPRTQIVAQTSPSTTYNFDISEGVVTEISWGEGLSGGGPNGDLCAL